jgi:hypothetical protein
MADEEAQLGMLWAMQSMAGEMERDRVSGRGKFQVIKGR